jgi:hypothetical protein
MTVHVKTRKKLYTGISNLSFPGSVQTFGGESRIHMHKINRTAYVKWENGKPCIPVNMYLLDNADGWTGDTALTNSSQLSFMVRYCGARKKRFDALTDADVLDFVSELQKERNASNPEKRSRDDNSVRRILMTCFNFLEWYQDNLYQGTLPLIGEGASGAAITCTKKKGPRGRHFFWSHRYLP